MKATKLLSIIIVLAFSYGCKDAGVFVGNGRYGLQFEQKISFPAGNPRMELFGASSLQIVDTLLLVEHQYENPTHYWDVYNLNNLEHLKPILRHGRGPNEALFSHYAGQSIRINDENWMFLMDVASGRLLKINLNKSILSGNDVVELVAPIESSKAPYFAVDRDTFLYCNKNSDKGYMSVMKGDKSWKNPLMEKKIYANVASEDFYKLGNSIYYNAKRNKLCVKPSYVNHLQIIDLEGDEDMVLSTADSDNWPMAQQQEFSDLTIFYTSIRITDDYIFALYTNKKIADWENSSEDIEVHIFNWEGDAVAKIGFKDHLTSFAVDLKNSILYGLDNREQLYTYDISSCLGR